MVEHAPTALGRPQLVRSATPFMLRWRLDFSTSYGSSYWCEVDAPSALQAITAALHHAQHRSGAATMFYTTSVSIQQLADHPSH